MLELPEDMAGRQVWQHAGHLLLAAEFPAKAAIEGATKQLDLALFLSFRLDMSGI
jgi:hypothetical protein